MNIVKHLYRNLAMDLNLDPWFANIYLQNTLYLESGNLAHGKINKIYVNNKLLLNKFIDTIPTGLFIYFACQLFAPNLKTELRNKTTFLYKKNKYAGIVWGIAPYSSPICESCAAGISCTCGCSPSLLKENHLGKSYRQ